MAFRFWLLALVLALPLVGFIVSEGVQGNFNSELRSVLREQYPNADEDDIQALTLDIICEDPDVDLPEICTDVAILNLMSDAALVAGVAGILLLAFIKFAGLLAKGSREVLLATFKPGLHITSIVLVTLVVIHASLAIGSLYYLGVVLGRLPIGLILVLGIGALAGVLALMRNTLGLVGKAQTFVIGLPVTPGQAPSLYERINNIAQKLGALPPSHVVVGLEPNFYVTEATVHCLRGTLNGRTLYCSLPLNRIMSIDEFDAIVAHELSHFKGLDTQFSGEFYPIYRGTADSLESLRESKGLSVIAVLPAIAVLSYFYKSFSTAESKFSRDRELAADRAGAVATSAQVLASALVKVHAFSPLWSTFQNAAVNALREGKAYTNASTVYASTVSAVSGNEALEGITDTHASHPTDSHPSLAARLESLDVSLESVTSAALRVQPGSPAHELVQDVIAVEEEISSAYQSILYNLIQADIAANSQEEENEKGEKG